MTENPPPPPDDAKMWRYMDFTKLISLLEECALYFCRADRLGDPFEGSVSQATPPDNTVSDDFDGSVGLRGFDVGLLRGISYVNCWHGGDYEAEAMWKLYARKKDGVAVRTTYGRFMEALIEDHAICVSRVQYRDYRKDPIPWTNAILPLFHKRVSFEHEREIRAVILEPPPEGSPEGPVGLYAKVDLEKLIEEIVVAPLAEDWFAKLVHSVADRYQLADRVTKSTIDDGPTFTAQYTVPKDQ